MTSPLVSVMKRGARLIGEGFTEPDADWAPVMMFMAGDGTVHPAILEIPFDLDERDNAARAMKELLAKHHAVEACLVLSAWCVIADHYDPDTEPRPAEHPLRQEVLTITHVTKDAATVEGAPIMRPEGKPPRLGSWGPPAEGLDAIGRFVNAMRQGIG